MGSLLGPIFEQKKYFGVFCWYTIWNPISDRFWDQILIVFSLISGWFLGMFFTFVVIGVIPANVVFLPEIPRFLKSNAIKFYVKIDIFS